MQSAPMASFTGVSADTCKRILKRHGFKRCKCRAKPILSEKNIKDSMNWAQNYEHQDWHQVLFTDGVAFEVGDDLKTQMCWREVNTEGEEKHLCPRKKKGKMLYVWGAVTHGKNFPLVRFALRPVRTVNKVRLAADKIDGKSLSESDSEQPSQRCGGLGESQRPRAHRFEKWGLGPHKMKGLLEERADVMASPI